VNKIWRALEPNPLEGTADGPYPGLRPFLPRERDIFFGREQMVDQVLVRLNERHMVVVHGASGFGKSSLIAAGVLPQLARRRARRGLQLRTGTFRPGIKPMQSLVGLLQDLCATEAGPASLEEVYCAIANGPEARAGVARLAAAAGVDQICIVVDQFEELFRFAEDEGFEEAQRFAELLVQLSGGAGRKEGWWEAEGEGDAGRDEGAGIAAGAEISFILTMRSEFLGNCARYRGLAEAINHTQYLLPNMERTDLIRAIREPAEVFEGSVDHALAERMADDAAREQDALPLVQHALMQMWRASDDRTLDLADYERALGACAQSDQAKQRGPLGAILAGHADRVLAEVTGGDPARLPAAEFIFRALTRKDSESRAIRCPQRFWRLARVSGVSAEETRAIVDGFRREGVSFLTPYAAMAEAIESDTVIDISHEALIRAWPRMSDMAIDPGTAQPVGWIEREAQDAMLWRWLSVHAEFFQTNPRAYLDGATSERLGTWFERIKQRPDWARAHLVRPLGKDDVTEEPEWRAVAQLLKASYDRTWLDRTMLRRWRKLGWLSLVLLLLVVAGAGWAGYELISRAEGLKGKVQVFEREEEAEKGLNQVESSVSAANDVLARANKLEGTRPTSEAETVDDRTAQAATAGGSFINHGDGQGWVWIGTIGPGTARVDNLRGNAGETRSPAEVQAGRRYWIRRNTVVRENFPTGNAPPRSIGIITRGALLTVSALHPEQSDGRTEYWARVSLVRTGLSRLRLSLANAQAVVGRDLMTQLNRIGYNAQVPRAAAEAAGRADVLYCHGADRAAAVRLAATITRWLGLNPGTQGMTMTPRPGEACDGVAPNELIVMLDFRPPGSAAGEGP
jgi:hypothetical protein